MGNLEPQVLTRGISSREKKNPLNYLFKGKGLEAQFRAGLCVLPLGKGGSNCWWKSHCCLCCCCCQTSPSPGSTWHNTVQIQRFDSADDHRNNVLSLMKTGQKQNLLDITVWLWAWLLLLMYVGRNTSQNRWYAHGFQHSRANDWLCLFFFFFWRLSCSFHKLYSKTTQLCSNVPVWDLFDCTHGIKTRLSLIQVM